jgi:hypothetical protein
MIHIGTVYAHVETGLYIVTIEDDQEIRAQDINKANSSDLNYPFKAIVFKIEGQYYLNLPVWL